MRLRGGMLGLQTTLDLEHGWAGEQFPRIASAILHQCILERVFWWEQLLLLNKKRNYTRMVYFFPDSSIRNKQSSPDGKLVGVIELSLEPANGHLASMTVRDLVGTGRDTHDMKPYLCNLCVDTAYRRQGIGQFLCKVCEKIAIQHWKRSDMYLHVIERLLVCMKTWAIEDLRWRHGWMEKYVMTFYTFTRF